MPKKSFTPEEIVAKLRQIEVLLSQGKTVPLACKKLPGTPLEVSDPRPHKLRDCNSFGNRLLGNRISHGG